jgi:hypothetical protein
MVNRAMRLRAAADKLHQEQKIKIDYTPLPRQLVLHSTACRQIFFGGAAGGSKMQSMDSTVYTPFGPKRMGDIEVGDQVANPDGSVARVIGVWPQGEQDLYRVGFDDGASCEVGLDHLWPVREARVRRFRKRAVEDAPNVWRLAYTSDLARLLKHGKHILVPLTAPVQFTVSYRYPKSRWPVEPYTLGAFLGDGHIADDQLSLCTADEEVLDAIQADGYRWRKKYTKPNNMASDYRYDSGLRKRFHGLGLKGARSWEKFIPEAYKVAPLLMRWQLMRGLMDTDGTADARGHASFSTVSDVLARDVQWLARSLGFKANITTVKAGYKKNGKRVETRPSHRVWIKGNNQAELFRLKRKKARALLPFNGGVSERSRRIVSVEFSRRAEAQCITVDNPNGLYLTDDFVVTHNSTALRMEAIALCCANPGLQAYLFRRVLPELEANHIAHTFNGIRYLPNELGRYHETHRQFQFVNGAVLHAAYAEQEADIKAYQGREMHWIGVDEATQFTNTQLNFMRGWNRTGSWKPAPGYEHVFPRIVFASNPGGPSHSYLKRTFIDPAPAETVFYDKTMRDPKDPTHLGLTSCFIPSKMTDNPYLDKNYAAQFAGFPPEQQRALIDGDWDAVVGAALELLTRENHMVRPFKPPRHWTHFMSIDWGTAAPFSVCWYCVSEGAELAAKDGWAAKWLPSGSVIMYRELYGWNGEENKGCRWDAARVARKIKEVEKEAGDPVLDYRVADNSMWANMGGSMNIAEHFIQEGMSLRPSKKDRKAGYSEIRSRLAGSRTFLKDGVPGDAPMLYVASNCTHFWRTVPVLTLDETDIDKGPNSKLEDHCVVLDTPLLFKDGIATIGSRIGTGGEIWTPVGWKKYQNCRLTRRDAEIVDVYAGGKKILTCTPDHRLLTSVGWMEARDCAGRSLMSSTPDSRCSKPGDIDPTRNIERVGDSAPIFRMGGQERPSCSTAKYGSMPRERFPWKCTSIISTAIQRIIASTISSACPPRTIIGCTSRNVARKWLSGSMRIWRAGAGSIERASSSWFARIAGRHSMLLRMAPILVEGFVPVYAAFEAIEASRIPGRPWSARQSWPRPARFATARSLLTAITNKSARSGVKTGFIATSVRPAGRADVYCLTVPEIECFALGNGVIVHNCYDSVVYGLMSRPYVSTEDDRWNAEFRRAGMSRQMVDPYAT